MHEDFLAFLRVKGIEGQAEMEVVITQVAAPLRWPSSP